jgi:hypothetical protein
MSYILKNTSGLVNTRITDTGRLKLSQGNFNIAYFQVGDSEVSYDKTPTNYNQTNTFILEPPFNTQNSSGVPQSNRQSVKYPYYVDGDSGNIFGIPYMDSKIESVYNRAPLRGFFTNIVNDEPTNNWKVLTNDKYVVSANYIVDISSLVGSNKIKLKYDPCNIYNTKKPLAGDFITIYYDGYGKYNCECTDYPPLPSQTPTATLGTTPTPTPTPTISPTDLCATPTPTPTPTKTECITPTPSRACPPPPDAKCEMPMSSCYPILTYKIVSVCEDEVTLDRKTPNYVNLITTCYARAIVYPGSMTSLYDSITPSEHWNDNVINFESICGTDEFDVKIWNMNIPWTETPAGLQTVQYEGRENFGSNNYIGSKEYFGYNSSSGHTDTSYTYYYNSFGEIVEVQPKEQKAIAIIHYTNQTIDFFYGEKFALQPYNNSNPDDTTGQARNFKLHIPWLMWHKNSECCFGETFWVDPPGFDNLELFKVNYIKSTKNDGMNQPGIRYYHLWDTNPNIGGTPNRVGKVFPDSKLVIIDDEEIIAAMSYKSNRNWTLPAPQLSLVTPNTCGDTSDNIDGIITSQQDTMFVTYRISNDYGFTNSLHSNYYSKIVGNNNICNPDTSKNVGIRFGAEFKCLVQPGYNPYTTTTTTSYTTTTTTSYITSTTTQCPTSCDVPKGYFGTKFEIICQKVTSGQRPDPTQWRIIDFTDQMSDYFIDGYITEESIIKNTFVITKELYDNASFYNLDEYIDLTPIGNIGEDLTFGDEYYFYGGIETDIQATIYEMNYKINLSNNEFKNTSNPTWVKGTNSYITEIALLDSNKDILVMSKLQSPVLRQGIQQFVVKLDI